MPYKTVGKKAREWADKHPNLAVAVSNLRGQAGMSENAIYHTLKLEVKKEDAPSIREIRGAWEKFEVEHLTIAGEKNRRIGVPHVQGEHARHPIEEFGIQEGKSIYRKRRAAQFPGERLAFPTEEAASQYPQRRKAQFSNRQVQVLDHKMVVAYLIHAEVPVSEWEQPELYLDLETERPYPLSPPF